MAVVQAFSEAQQIADAQKECWIAIAVSGNFLSDGNVGARVERRQQIELLENKTDFTLAHTGALGIGERREVVAIHDHFAGVSPGQSAQQIEESRLAAAGGADDGDEFSLLHAEGDAAQCGYIDLPYAISFA